VNETNKISKPIALNFGCNHATVGKRKLLILLHTDSEQTAGGECSYSNQAYFV